MDIRTATLSITYLIILSFTKSASCYFSLYFSVLAYNEPDYGGSVTNCKVICNVTEIISIQLTSGSCMQIVEKSGRSTTHKEDVPNTEYYYDGQISACPFHSKTIECPTGSFVKKIEWSNKSELTDGVKLSCGKPESSSLDLAPGSSTSKVTHKVDCPVLTELTFRRNVRKDSDIEVAEVTGSCKAINTTKADSLLQCQNLKAISGVTFSIENETKYIKKSRPICSGVPNIHAKCKVKDEREKLKSNTRKAVGVGQKSFEDMTDEEKTELHFYNHFQFETEYTLSTNFKNNLGVSSTTKYDWRSAPKSTWQKERAIAIQIEKSDKCNTEIFEIVGKCSYMTVRPYYLERVDHCFGKSYKTIQEISHTIHKRSYISEIPISIKNKINEQKQQKQLYTVVKEATVILIEWHTIFDDKRFKYFYGYRLT